MPANLAKAHAVLDKAVDAAYKEDGGAASYIDDGERVAFLFERYAGLTSHICRLVLQRARRICFAMQQFLQHQTVL